MPTFCPAARLGAASRTCVAVEAVQPVLIVVGLELAENLPQIGPGSRRGCGPGAHGGIPRSTVRRLRSCASALQPIATDQIYCDGYQPKCDSLHSLSDGAYYSILCRDIQPFTDRRALAKLAGHDPAYIEAFVHDPYLDVCTRWKVRPASPPVASPVHTNVPTLMFAGQFDPFGALPITRQAATTFSRSWVEEVPSIGHNVFGVDECSRSIRSAWADNPTSPPASTGCLARLHLIFTPQIAP